MRLTLARICGEVCQNHGIPEKRWLIDIDMVATEERKIESRKAAAKAEEAKKHARKAKEATPTESK